MNLKFGILWLEDQFSPAEHQQIVDAAHGHGFEVEVKNYDNGADLDQLAREQELHYPFDLLLIDWHLKQADGADEAKRARDLFPATPILFYSANESYGQLKKMIFERGVEGVFVSQRDDFTRRTGELIGNLAASFNRLAGMRGLAARVLAECDDHHKAILIALSKQGLEDEVQQALVSYVESAADTARDEFEAARERGIEDLLVTRAVTSQILYMAVRRITKNRELRDHLGDPLSAARRRTKDFVPQVIAVRNVLGHVLEERTDEGWVIRGPGTDGINRERFPELRRSFLENLEATKELRRLLVPE